jgi:transglutaminase-like putative cysteine protease
MSLGNQIGAPRNSRAGAVTCLVIALALGCGGDRPDSGSDAQPARPADASATTTRAVKEPAEVSAPAETPAADELVPALKRARRASSNAAREIERENFDIRALVRRVGREPAALFEWVRDSTEWLPYLGSSRGAVGVLISRRGNSLDRSLLLAEMMRAAGYKVELARRSLDDAQAQALIGAALSTVSSPRPTRDWTRPLDFSAASAEFQFGADMDDVGREAAARALGRLAQSHAELMSVLRDRVTTQTAALLGSLEALRATESIQPSDKTLRAVRDHWWVRVKADTAWSDFDLLSGPGGLDRDARSLRVNAIPDSLFHRVAIRVVIEQWTPDGLREREVLARRLRAADAAGKRLMFWHEPIGDDQEAGAAGYENLEDWIANQRAWRPVLAVDGRRIAGKGFTETGDLGGGKSGGRGSPFGGLGGTLAGGKEEQTEDGGGNLTGEWLEFEICAPGEPCRSVRRPVFDLLGSARREEGGVAAYEPAADARSARAWALMGRSDLMIQTYELTPAYANYLIFTQLAAQEPIVSKLVRDGDLRARPAADDPVAYLLSAVPAHLYAFALARTLWSEDERALFVDRPNVLAYHQGIRLTENGELRLWQALDVVSNSMGVRDDSNGSGFEMRVRQGVFETNLEALFLAAIGKAENTANLFVEARQRGVGWRVVQRADDPSWEQLDVPTGAAALLRKDVADGFVAVAPERAVPIDGRAFFGWWRVDPRTGQTLGMGQAGYGQGLTEKMINFAASAGPGIGVALWDKHCELEGDTDGLCDPCVIFFAGAASAVWSMGFGAILANTGQKSFLGWLAGTGWGAYSSLKRFDACFESMDDWTRRNFKRA